MNYFIADTHFGCERILVYERRPFKSVDAMDEAVMRNWNKVVSKEDTVYVLGDVSTHSIERTKEIIQSLNGRKVLVLGNHDMNWTEDIWRAIGFDFVSKYEICVDRFYWCSHEPMYMNSSMPYVNVHGHLHGNVVSTPTKPNQYVNVSVETIKYAPVSFDAIKSMLLSK